MLPFIGEIVLEKKKKSLTRMLLIEQLRELNLCFVPVTGVLAVTTASSFVSDGSSGTRDMQG